MISSTVIFGSHCASYTVRATHTLLFPGLIKVARYPGSIHHFLWRCAKNVINVVVKPVVAVMVVVEVVVVEVVLVVAAGTPLVILRQER